MTTSAANKSDEELLFEWNEELENWDCRRTLPRMLGEAIFVVKRLKRRIKELEAEREEMREMIRQDGVTIRLLNEGTIKPFVERRKL